MNVRHRAIAGLASLLFPYLTWAQNELQIVPAPDPQVELSQFKVEKGFRVNLFASDPRLSKPIQIHFDPQGRLWVASSPIYPQIAPDQEPSDKILVLEDTDGDGRADRSTVFAEGLYIPSGVAPGDDGVYVGHGSDLIHLRDTDGDGKADSKRVVLSGFGTEDTHHQLHGLTWGPDGALYMLQGYFCSSHIETPHGVLRLNGGGAWRFTPSTHRLEIYSRGLVNPWGIQFDRWGQSFQTDGAGGEGINYSFPGVAYRASPGQNRILQGLNPGTAKLCGIEVLSGRHLPDEFQGNILSNDFRANKVYRYEIVEDGSGYAANRQPNFLESSHVSFRPVDITMGPDGAIYIADWYSPIIQHGEVNFRDPRRDHDHGRIWRVSHRGRRLVERPKLIDASTDELLDSLKAQEDHTRYQARRVLAQRDAKSVERSLELWLKSMGSAEEDEHHLLEGLWLSQSLGIVNHELLYRLLSSTDHRVRAAAVRVAADWQAELPSFEDLIRSAIEDTHPRVRLEAVRALSTSTSPASVQLALRVLDRPMDQFIHHALARTVLELEPAWFAAFEAGKLDFDKNISQLVYALEALDSPAAAPHLLQLIAKKKLPSESEMMASSAVASHGGPAEIAKLLDHVLESDSSDNDTLVKLTALLESTQRRKVRPTGKLGKIQKLIDSKNSDLRKLAIRAAGVWKIESMSEALRNLAFEPNQSLATRTAAVESLGDLEEHAVLEGLASSADERSIRIQAAISMIALDSQKAARLSAPILKATQDTEEASTVFRAFLQHTEGPSLLAGALENFRISPKTARTGIYWIGSSGREEPDLSEVLIAAAELLSEALLVAPPEMPEFIKEVESRGDAQKGEVLFRSDQLACAKCHRIAGSGGLVGPDLTSIGTRAQIDYLVESVLDPNETIKEGYRTVNVRTRDGRLFSGIGRQRSRTDLFLRDSADQRISIPLDSIEELNDGLSLMPSGLTVTLSRDEFVDLIRFMFELGREKDLN